MNKHTINTLIKKNNLLSSTASNMFLKHSPLPGLPTLDGKEFHTGKIRASEDHLLISELCISSIFRVLKTPSTVTIFIQRANMRHSKRNHNVSRTAHSTSWYITNRGACSIEY